MRVLSLLSLVLISGAQPVTKLQDPILVAGLKVWRKPGAIQGGAACASCHSPDGIELAVYGFDDANLMRRAVPHLGAKESRTLVAYLHALKLKLKVVAPRDPNLDRPLQPGGRVLAGGTAAERDLAFGLELRKYVPALFAPQIDTIDQAKVAESELLRVSLQDLRIGIPLNRLSEDFAHGNDHSTIAQWLPELGSGVAKKQLAGWYSEQDKYITKPTVSNLKALLDAHSRMVNTSRMMGFSALSVLKYRALLVWQDRLRNHVDSVTSRLASEVAAYGNYNPIWEVGEMARQMMDRDPASLGMDAENQRTKLAGGSLANQLHSLRLSWFWAGWLSDQGLFKTSHDDKTRLGMWLSESLSQDGPYPMHNVFANARRQAVVSNDVMSWGEPLVRRRRIWEMAGLRSFNFQTRDLPNDPEYRKLVIGFTANCFRMNLLLLQDDIQRTGAVWVKQNTTANIAEMIEFIRTYDPAHASRADDLQAKLLRLVEKAHERNQFAPQIPTKSRSASGSASR